MSHSHLIPTQSQVAALIDNAVALRKSGNHIASIALLEPLLAHDAYRAQASLHIAWNHDQQSQEQQAVQHYQAALEGPLLPSDRFDALFGLASTLRSLGDYQQARHYFELTLQEFPEHLEVKPFYAMCLYNLGDSKSALALLLELLVSTTDNAAIQDYQRAIRLYAADLDRTW
ncbi:Tetratrico peptide repeat-containing protein [Vibrio xiamenensis]|uniref:Tetratrico peptide repeat-containing protein n=1 Tax=Vibrio xiamenensis TaxID=861298 RepID=A0A1G8GAF6_9VIBR|nr:tetratricopeptide repeat protein [Vibrio xiamenensis]SDH91387.1 Tetratrico peptide repeat-containing protein [Vibrio xiamenensis]